jgi:hypothetical protein
MLVLESRWEKMVFVPFVAREKNTPIDGSLPDYLTAESPNYLISHNERGVRFGGQGNEFCEIGQSNSCDVADWRSNADCSVSAEGIES